MFSLKAFVRDQSVVKLHPFNILSIDFGGRSYKSL